MDGRTLEADLCVVGSGPAGLSLVRALLPLGIRVVMLESGDRRLDPRVEALSGGRSTGDPYASLALSRARRAGGTAHIWNTQVGNERAAKYVPLDPIDFESRDWMPLSGWPFPRAALEPWYVRAQSVCGLGKFDYEAPAWNDLGEAGIESETIRSGVYQLGAAHLFTRNYPEQMHHAPNVVFCTGATVIGLDLDASGETVTGVRAACLSGERFAVRARWVVLAAGGLENPRLLLLANLDRVHGPSSMIGRCFMDHPRDLECTLIPADARRFQESGAYDVRCTAGGAIRRRLALRETVMRDERLMNLSATFRHPSPARRALWGLFRGRAEWGPGARRTTRVPARVPMELHLEQAPHPENRLWLGRTRDAFGLPRIELHWRWREADRRSHVRARARLAAELERCGIGHVELPARTQLDPNAHHPMGATRMSRDPRLGVVDEDCRVHGVSNLFVAGSSVFPTSGYANPTLTLVALALRLGDHLVSRLGRARPAQAAQSEAFTRS